MGCVLCRTIIEKHPKKKAVLSMSKISQKIRLIAIALISGAATAIITINGAQYSFTIAHVVVAYCMATVFFYAIALILFPKNSKKETENQKGE